MGSQRRHDNLIDLVEKEMRERGWEQIYKNVEYKTKRKEGEIDLCARKGNYVIAFEMKCTNTPKAYMKARNQLFRMERYFFRKKDRVFKMYVTYSKPKSLEYTIHKIIR